MSLRQSHYFYSLSIGTSTSHHPQLFIHGLWGLNSGLGVCIASILQLSFLWRETGYNDRQDWKGEAEGWRWGLGKTMRHYQKWMGDELGGATWLEWMGLGMAWHQGKWGGGWHRYQAEPPTSPFESALLCLPSAAFQFHKPHTLLCVWSQWGHVDARGKLAGRRHCQTGEFPQEIKGSLSISTPTHLSPGFLSHAARALAEGIPQPLIRLRDGLSGLAAAASSFPELLPPIPATPPSPWEPVPCHLYTTSDPGSL